MQNCVTRHFLGKGDAWHQNPAEARDFGTNQNAIAYYISHRMEHAQIVLHFDAEPQFNITIPLSDCRRH